MKTATPAPAGLVQPHVPTLTHVTELSKECGGTIDQYGRVPFHRANDPSSVSFSHRLFRLWWPGEAHGTVFSDDGRYEVRVVRGCDEPSPTVPTKLAFDLVRRGQLDSGRIHLERPRVNLSELVWQTDPAVLTDVVSQLDEVGDPARYHLDVNRWLYGVPRSLRPDHENPEVRTGREDVLRAPLSVGPLDASMVDEVLDARFALPVEAIRDIGSLRSTIDNLLRDRLLDPDGKGNVDHAMLPVVASALRVYFEILQDHLYDHVDSWWLRDRRLWADKAMILLLSRFWSVGPRQLLLLSGVLNSEGAVRRDLLGHNEHDSAEEELYRACDGWVQCELGVELLDLQDFDGQDVSKRRVQDVRGTGSSEISKGAPERRLVGEISAKEAPENEEELRAAVRTMEVRAIEGQIEVVMEALQPIHVVEPTHYHKQLEERRGMAMERGDMGTVRLIDVEIARIAKIVAESGEEGPLGMSVPQGPVPKIEIAAADNPYVAPEVLRVLELVRGELQAEAPDMGIVGLAMDLIDRIRVIFEIDAYPPEKIPMKMRGEIERKLIVEAITLHGRMEKIMKSKGKERDPEIEALLAEVGEDDEDLGDDEIVDRTSTIEAQAVDPSTERVRAPMSMPYDTGDARSAAGGPGHRDDARIATLLKSIAETGASVDEVKEVFPELADVIDRALENDRGDRGGP